jgi:hypothetical protein
VGSDDDGGKLWSRSGIISLSFTPTGANEKSTVVGNADYACTSGIINCGVIWQPDWTDAKPVGIGAIAVNNQGAVAGIYHDGSLAEGEAFEKCRSVWRALSARKAKNAGTRDTAPQTKAAA